MSSRKKNLCLRTCIGLNVCVLLYLGVQFLYHPLVGNEHDVTKDQERATVLELKNKRTLHSVVENQTTINPVDEQVAEPIQCLEKT